MGLVQNPDNQNPDKSKSRHQNPDKSKSRNN